MGNGAVGSTGGGLGGGSGHEAGYGKAADSGGSGAVMTIQNVRARESVLVAGWVFEPEAEAVGMRGGAFEGPLVSRKSLGKQNSGCFTSYRERKNRVRKRVRLESSFGVGVRVCDWPALADWLMRMVPCPNF